jgi:iron complex outermembrane receptor protein
MSRLLCLAALSIVLLAPLASVAQEQTVPAADSGPVIEEIVVTAQKRVQSAQDVPLSVAAIGGDQLENLKLTDTNDLAGLVPNLQVNQINGDGAPVFAVRGVTMNDYSVHQSSPVAVYTDEVYAGPTVLQPMQMFDLERVEVLRGPQGTLYGRNSTGGAVNLVTKAPDFEADGYLTAGYGNFSRAEVRGAVGVPIVDDVLAVRLAGYWIDAKGWFENDFGGVPDNNQVEEWALRGSLRFTPTETLDIVARYSAGRSDPTNYGVYADNIGEIGVGLGADVYDIYSDGTINIGELSAPDYTRAGLGKFELESNGRTKRKREVDQASLHVNWDFTESFTLTSVTSWTQGDFLNPEDTDGAPIEMLEIAYFGDGDQIAQDLRVTSNLGGRFEFVAGIYYGHEELDVGTDLGLFTDIDLNMSGAVEPTDCNDTFETATPGGDPSPAGDTANLILAGLGLSLADLAGLGCVYRNSFNQERQTIAGYFDGTFEVFDSTTLLFGLRVTNDETKVKNFRTVAVAAGTPLFDTIPSVDDKIDDTELTWKLGVEQRLGEDALVYFTYSRGYRSGAFNGQAFFLPEEFNSVKPETLDAIELGVKSTLADGRLQLNGAIFYYIYKDQQLINVDPSTLAQTLVNIDESNVLGLEFEALLQATENLRLSAGFGWLDGEAEKGVVTGIDVSGDTLPNSPDLNLHAALDWDFLFTDFGHASFHLDAGFTDAQYFTLPHVPRVLVDDYLLLNTRIGFTGQDERWEVAFWVKNLTDEWYQTSIVNLADSFGYDYSHIGPPVTYGGELTFRF